MSPYVSVGALLAVICIQGCSSDPGAQQYATGAATSTTEQQSTTTSLVRVELRVAVDGNASVEVAVPDLALDLADAAPGPRIVGHTPITISNPGDQPVAVGGALHPDVTLRLDERCLRVAGESTSFLQEAGEIITSESAELDRILIAPGTSWAGSLVAWVLGTTCPPSDGTLELETWNNVVTIQESEGATPTGQVVLRFEIA